MVRWFSKALSAFQFCYYTFRLITLTEWADEQSVEQARLRLNLFLLNYVGHLMFSLLLFQSEFSRVCSNVQIKGDIQIQTLNQMQSQPLNDTPTVWQDVILQTTL